MGFLDLVHLKINESGATFTNLVRVSKLQLEVGKGRTRTRPETAEHWARTGCLDYKSQLNYLT